MGFTAYITYIISFGWTDYIIEERDKLDSFEDTREVQLAEGNGATAMEALEAALAAIPGNILDLQKEAQEAEFGSALINDALEATPSLMGGEWKFQWNGITKLIEQGEGDWHTRFDIAIYNDDFAAFEEGAEEREKAEKEAAAARMAA